jgi:hypothetical protein
MTRTAIIALAIGAALALAAPAAAEPLAISSSTPADRATLPPTPTGGIAWQITAAAVPDDAMVSVTVSSSPATGPDGTLPTDNRVDFFFLSTSGVPGGWSGRSDPGPNAWSANVGTYYWQVVATWTDAGGVFHSGTGPIARLGIGTAPAAAPPSTTTAPAGARTTTAMSPLDALFYVRTVIRRHTKRPAVGLHYSCARLNSRAFRCRPAWRDSRNVYTTTATFTHVRSGGRIVARATASGRRASRQCVRTRSVARCARPFRWRSVVAARPVGSR